jgi:chemotaxis family two-component system sensor kinase Cph1
MVLASLASPGQGLPNIVSCDSEPIHIPGSIQPHGLLLIADTATFKVVGGAGQIEERLAENWLGRPLIDLIGRDVSSAVEAGRGSGPASHRLADVQGRSEKWGASLHLSGHHALIELEPVETDKGLLTPTLDWLDQCGFALETASGLTELCARGAEIFRELTGFDRVMVYKFLDDGTGTVVGEARDPKLSTFLNHRFPASDIPAQARALYVRNRVRSIPDVNYVPHPLRPASAGLAAIDLSDVALRSVSPIHIQYLRNMKLAASASVSIVKDGALWGLIACHHLAPRHLGYEVRLIARTLAGGLARQIKAKQEAASHRQMKRLRQEEDELAALALTQSSLDGFVAQAGEKLRDILDAGGLAICKGSSVRRFGIVPPDAAIKDIVATLQSKRNSLFASRELLKTFPAMAGSVDIASGLLAFTLPANPNISFLWFRPEQIEEVNWAGNPHKEVSADPMVPLSPRASFESWTELERGRSTPWTDAEIGAALRIRQMLNEAYQQQELRRLVTEKDYLIGEINHRVQNSLQLVSAYLNRQIRSTDNADVAAHLSEAQRRITAVGLVHKRLYKGDQPQSVNLAQYLSELTDDLKASMGPEWSALLSLNLASVDVPASHAISMGLILTELIINTQKYAYDGEPGPIAVELSGDEKGYRLTVSDRGKGKRENRQGFGSRMIEALVQRVSATLEFADNDPGLRAVITAPLATA